MYISSQIVLGYPEKRKSDNFIVKPIFFSVKRIMKTGCSKTNMTCVATNYHHINSGFKDSLYPVVKCSFNIFKVVIILINQME